MHHATAVLVLAAALSAQTQIPLPTFQSTFTGTAATRGFFFQAPVALTIVGLRVPDETNNGTQCVELRRMTASPPAYPATGNDPQVFFASNVPSSQIIQCSVTFQQGEWIGVLGACGTTTMYNWYGAGAFASSVLGQPITLMRFLTQTNLHTTGGNQLYSSEGTGQIARVEVYVAPPTGYATSTNYGVGCNLRYGTFYENFATAAAFDLANSGLSMINNGNGSYLTLAGFGTFVTPPATAATIAAGNDVEQTVTLASPLPTASGPATALTVCSNGYVSTAVGNGVAALPSAAGFVAFPHTCWATWHDFNPPGGGSIRFHEQGSISYVTWQGVADNGGSGTSTFQYQFDRSNGNVNMIWGAMSSLGTSGFLAGFKVSGTVQNPGSRDLSALLPATIVVGTDIRPLTLDAMQRPVLGTPVTMRTTNCGTAALGAIILSLTQHDPGLPLVALGMGECRQFTGPDVVLTFLPTTGTGNIVLTIPANPAFAAMHMYCQSAAFVTGVNPLGVLASNGVDLKVDLL